MENNIIVLRADSVKYCSQFDEDAFFEWLNKIQCISQYDGEGSILYIYILRNLVDDCCLREVLAIFYRYNIDMKQLVVFMTKKNKGWLSTPTAYWFDRVFNDYK